MGFKNIVGIWAKPWKRAVLVFLPTGTICVIAGFTLDNLYPHDFFSLTTLFLDGPIFAILLIVSLVFIRRLDIFDCPYCSTNLSIVQPWICPECSHHNGSSIFWACARCGHPPAAFECPICSKVMILTKPALKWDDALVLKHVARAVVPPESPPPEPPKDPTAVIVETVIKDVFGDKLPPRDLLKLYVAGLTDLILRYPHKDDPKIPEYVKQLVVLFHAWLPSAAYNTTGQTTVPLGKLGLKALEDHKTHYSFFPPALHARDDYQYESWMTRAEKDKAISEQLDRRAYKWSIDPTNRFRALLEYPVPVEVQPAPTINLPLSPAVRFEHQWVMAKTGHGKTTLFQEQIKHDLGTDCSIIVIDTQGRESDLINNLTTIASLQDHMVYIDPTDVEYPLSLALFKLGSYRAVSAEDEVRQRTQVLDLIRFTLESLMQADMTRRQTTLFTFAISAMLVIPEANIRTLMDFLRPGGQRLLEPYLDRLDETDRSFYQEKFKGMEFAETKAYVADRIYALLQNKVFEGMFCATESRIDFLELMQTGKVVVINADKNLLGDGTEVYARFFIALLEAAIQRRISTVPKSERKPCFVYMDEFGDYAKTADTRITNLFQQARKANVGVTVGHTKLGDLDPKTLDALSNNTSTKFVGAIQDHGDASKMARNIHCDATWLMKLPKLTFATYLAGSERALPATFTPGALDDFPKVGTEEIHQLRLKMRQLYSVQPKPHGRDEKIQDAEFEEVNDEPTPRFDLLRLTAPKKRKRPKKRGPRGGDVDTAAS